MMEAIRKIPIAVIAALVVQTVGGLVWAGGAAARIATLEERVGEQRLVAERLARLEEQSLATRAAELFAALSDPTRVRIVGLLAHAELWTNKLSSRTDGPTVEEVDRRRVGIGVDQSQRCDSQSACFFDGVAFFGRIDQH